MSRRRYISTEISVDTRVNRLVTQHGDFAALLYTWMIPHAADDRTLPADPEQLMLMVIPGQRHRTVEDVSAALDAMIELGLLECTDGVLRYPQSFYKHQSYIKEERRKSAQNAAMPRTAVTPAQNVASSSSSSSFPVSSSEPIGSGGQPSGEIEAPEQNSSPSAPPQIPTTPVGRVKPAPKKPNGPDLAPLFDAFQALSLPRPAMLGREPTAAQSLLSQYSAEHIAACWQDYASGVYGSAVDRSNLSFGYLTNNNRVGNWLTRKNASRGSPKPSTNGVYESPAVLADRAERTRIGQQLLAKTAKQFGLISPGEDRNDAAD